MKIKHFFDQDTATYTYIVTDEQSNQCAIIDSVLNYDQYAGKTSTTAADIVIAYVKENNLTVEWILETHAHADHLTASQYLKDALGGKIAIGENITKVAEFWSPIFNSHIKMDGSDFDMLLKDGQVITIGNLALKAMNTPGHTPACMCYVIEDVVFVGDTIFQPYVGTARCDFPGGSAKDLYQSVQKILSLPDATRIFVAHDYPVDGNAPKCMTTVLEEKQHNMMIKQGVSEADFVTARNKKDENKAVPKLLIPSIQFNLRAGSFGDKEDNGVHYIKVPVDKL